MSFWERNRRRITVACTAAGAGIAAYYAYKSWYPNEERHVGSEADTEGRREQPLPPDPAAAKEEAEAQAKSVKAHFDSIQRISYSTTLPTLLPLIKDKVFELTDIESLTERLQQARSGAITLTAEEKLACWDELKVASVARAVAASWALCLVDLMLRVQLNLLGRHLYIGGAGAEAGGVGVSDACQRAFMAHAEFLPQKGLAHLCGLVGEAAKGAAGGTDLKQVVRAGDVVAMLGRASDALEAEIIRSGWHGILLPPPGGALMGGMLAPADQMALDGLVAEAARVTGSRQFMAAARIMSQECAGAVCRGLEVAMASAGPPAGMPFAKVVPLVAGEGGGLLEKPDGALRAMAANRSIENFCASVYTSV